MKILLLCAFLTCLFSSTSGIACISRHFRFCVLSTAMHACTAVAGQWFVESQNYPTYTFGINSSSSNSYFPAIIDQRGRRYPNFSQS